MADFQEVVIQKRRMCKKYDGQNCNGCPLSDGKCRIVNIRFTDSEDIRRFEDTVMLWAAEHPEPVYPTWLEWLHTTSATDGSPDIPVGDGTIFRVAINNIPIPADIAEKLGIEPKEG